MELDAILTELGLTDTEATLYQTLLRENTGTASALAKKAGINRRLAYDKMQNLIDNGLASYIDKDNKRIYKPTDPSRIRDMIADQRKELDTLENKLDDEMDELKAQFNENQDEREVRIMEGKQGIKQLFNEELRQDETIYVIGSPTESETLLEHFLPSWTEKRAAKGIDLEGVFEHEMRGKVGQRAPLNDRYLPEGQKSKVSISMFGDTVGIIFWIDDPLVIMIDDPDAAESFMSYYDLIWDAAEE